MTTREEVVSAYRILLGREPENETVVERLRASSPDLNALRQRFLSSPEFQSRLSSSQRSHPVRVSRQSPPMAVDLDVPPEKLARLFAKTAKQWLHLGETDPHWSVLSTDRFRRATFGDNREAFYASGESSVHYFGAAMERAGIDFDRAGRLLELGCGVGRVTAHLARHVREVVAVDISAAHLRLAREYMDEMRLENVRLEQLEAVDDLAGLGQFDAFFTVIVLQHNSPPVMARLLGAMLASLRPGGVGYFQVPTHRVGYHFRIDEYLARSNETEMEMHCLPQHALFELLTVHGCRLMEIREDDAAGPAHRCISNTLLVQKLASV